MKTRRDGKVRPARYQALQLPVLLWLTVIWVILWGDLSVLTVLGGFVVAVISCFVFPLPPLRLDVRVRPIALGWLVTRFVWDVIVSSIQVAWVVLKPNHQLRNAIVEVNLRTPSDFVLTVVSEMTCLIPGSLVVEARRSTHTLFLHVLDVKDLDAAERFRQSVLDLECRLVRALGHHVDHLDQPAEATPSTSGENS